MCLGLGFEFQINREWSSNSYIIRFCVLAWDLAVKRHFVLKYLEGEPIYYYVMQLYIGTYMKSLNMKGLSIIILYLDEYGILILFLTIKCSIWIWKSW